MIMVSAEWPPQLRRRKSLLLLKDGKIIIFATLPESSYLDQI
jgi:hypothetical protein